MLQLYDSKCDVNKVKIKIEGLTKYKDYKIESVLDTGDKTLSFSYPSAFSSNILEECYIRNETDEFVIKETKDDGKWKSVVAVMNVEDLEGKAWEYFDSTNQSIERCLDLVLVGTGWTAKIISNIDKERTVRKTNCSSWDLIQEVKKVYRVELEFDTINKIVKVYDKIGTKKGTYFIDSLNLKELEVETNSYDYFTKIIALGKGNIRVELVDNQYSDKIKTLIWKDEKYTNIVALTEDARLKLNELSKPYKSYRAKIIDLASINEKYKNIVDYKLGDTIVLISKGLKIKEEQRIVKITEYPDDPMKNDCEMANTTLSFKDLQKEFKDSSNTVSNITEDNGKISEKAIKEAVDKITIDKVSTNDFIAVEGRIGKLEVSKLNANEANIEFANINKAIANKIEVTDLIAKKIDFKVASGEVLDLQVLLSKFITGENGQFLSLTSDNVVIDNSVIKDLIASNISVSDLKAGNIDSNRFNIVGSSGNLLIKDNTIQIKDSNRTRVQIGKDASNDYNMYVWDSTGKLMFDATGLKADGIKSKIIRDDMISDTANINGAKINISSLITEVNKDTNTQVIKASKVAFDSTGQSLEVNFSSLKNNVDSKESRNLALKTNIPVTFTGNNTVNQVGPLYNIDGLKIINKIVTVSFDFSKSEGASGVFRIQSGASHWSFIIPSQNIASMPNRIIKTVIVPVNGDKTFSRIEYRLDNAIGTFTISNLKVELGENLNPLWTQAPEDVNSKIEANTTAITATQEDIETLVKNTTIEKDGQNIQLKDAYTNFTQEYDTFKFNVSNTYTTKTETSALGNLINQNKQSIRCNDLGTKINYSRFDYQDLGEIYLHGFDDNNNPSDINGKIYWSGKAIIVPKGMINPNSDCVIGGDIYLFMNVTNQTVVMGTWYDSAIKSWKYKMFIGGTSTGTLNPTNEHVAIGIINMKDAESFNYAYLFETPQSLKALTVGSMDILTRMNSTELKITDSAITASVSNAINAGTAAITTTQFVMDKRGLEVNHSNVFTKTRLDAEGLYILDENGDTIASLASKETWTELKADKVFANNIENIYEGAANLYVDHNANNIIRDGSINYPFTSFYQLMIFLSSTPIINKTININVITNSNVDEQLSLSGLKGYGSLNIYFNKNFILRGKGNYDYAVQMANIDISVKINGGRTTYNSNDGAYFVGSKNGMMFVNCKFVQVEYLCINSLIYGVGFINTNGYTFSIDFCDTPNAIANTGANVHDESSCGNCTSNYISIRAGITTYGGEGNGYKPQGSIKEQSGKVFEISPRASTGSFRTKPPAPTTIDTYQSFSFSDYGYYSDLYGNWNPNGKSIYQGNWGYGNNRGVFTFNNISISSFLSGATILDGSTITLQRENAGGYSGPQTVYLYGTTHTSAGGSEPPATKYYTGLGTLAWGESKTFNLPKVFVQDLKSGVIKSVMLYTSDGSNYIKFSPVCTLRLKVNK